MNAIDPRPPWSSCPKPAPVLVRNMARGWPCCWASFKLWPIWTPISKFVEDGHKTKDVHQDGQLAIFSSSSIHNGLGVVVQDGHRCVCVSQSGA